MAALAPFCPARALTLAPINIGRFDLRYDAVELATGRVRPLADKCKCKCKSARSMGQGRGGGEETSLKMGKE